MTKGLYFGEARGSTTVVVSHPEVRLDTETPEKRLETERGEIQIRVE